MYAKITSLLIAFTLVISLSACGGDSNGSGNDTDNPTSSAQAGGNPKGDESQASSDSGSLGDYAVTIKDAKLVKNWEDEDALLITLDFTNNGEKGTMYMTSISTKAFQDGIELESSFLSSNNPDYNDNASKEIKKGVTLEVTECFVLNNTKSPVEIEASELFSLSDTKLLKTFEIS
jgi:hypothetical protein